MSKGIRLIVGLGNPGAKYEATRHNVGFWFVDELARRANASFRPETKFFGETCRIRINDQECWLLKPATFVNRSGQSVSAFAKFYKLPVNQILVVHDELDLPAGTCRLKKGGGHGGHNGLRDTIKALDSAEFYRLRLGIDHPGHKDQVVDFVLSRPSRSDQETIDQSIDRAAGYLPELLEGQYAQAMNELHRD